MPYIKPEDRKDFAEGLEKLDPQNPGELNYVISKILLKYTQKDIKYSRFNDAIGATECAKLELYRRFVVPYEEKKISENGDII